MKDFKKVFPDEPSYSLKPSKKGYRRRLKRFNRRLSSYTSGQRILENISPLTTPFLDFI